LKLVKRNDNWRGACPACKSSDDRALSITEGRGFRCWTANVGGDVIELVAHVRGTSAKEAASWIAAATGTVPQSSGRSRSTAPASPQKAKETPTRSFDPDAYFRDLDLQHEAVEALGLSPATCERFQCGFAKKGVLAGRLAVRVDDPQGKFMAFIGIKEGEPLKCPSNFDPSGAIFGLSQVDGSEVRLVRSVIDVLRAYEDTGESAIAFLTDLIGPEQHELLAIRQTEQQFHVFY
jgi:hypothetical protein